jgi:hypothetical protein
MNDFARNYLPWLMSAMTIYMTFLQGEKRLAAWVVGLLNQFLWLAFALATYTWGLLPLNAALWYLYIRNFLKWRNVVVEANPLGKCGYSMSEAGGGKPYRLIMGFETLSDLQDAHEYVARLPKTRA